MSDTEGWVTVAAELTEEQSATVQKLLDSQEIACCVVGAAVQVPAELENDAQAVLAGLEESEDMPVDGSGPLARLTAKVTDVGRTAFDAAAACHTLAAAGIEATTDGGGPIQNTEAAALQEFHVLVAPDKLQRAKAVLAGDTAAFAEEAARAERLSAATTVLAEGLGEREADALVHTLGTAGIAATPTAEEGGTAAVRVLPRDEVRAHDMLRRMAHTAAETNAENVGAENAAAAAGATDEGAPEKLDPSSATSVVVLIVLALLAFVVMRTCT